MGIILFFVFLCEISIYFEQRSLRKELKQALSLIPQLPAPTEENIKRDIGIIDHNHSPVDSRNLNSSRIQDVTPPVRR